MSAPLKLFVDTNVWLDYYLYRNERHENARKIIAAAVGEIAVLYVTDSVMKDFFFLYCRTMKNLRRAAGDTIDDNVSLSIRQSAWACLDNMRRRTLIVSVGGAEVLLAFSYRQLHGDFEDDLLIAAAQRAGVDYFVTSDEQLMSCSPLPCLKVEDTVRELEFRNASQE